MSSNLDRLLKALQPVAPGLLVSAPGDMGESASATGGAGENSRNGSNSPLHVLVVDDEPLIRWSLVETLQGQGHAVTEAGDGASAIRMLSEQASRPVDVILLDFRLPDSDDLTLLSTLRRLSPRSQVIMMTAYGLPEVTSRAIELGVYKVLSKPFELGDLPALVRRAHAAAGSTG